MNRAIAASAFGFAWLLAAGAAHVANGARETTAASDASRRPGRWRLAVGVFAGGLMVDPRLEDYRWDTRPAGLTGVEVTVLRGRLAAGARVWGAHTTQASGIPGESRAPRVNLTGVGAVGRVRAARIGGVELWGTGYAGRIDLRYEPDRLTFDPGGAAEPVTVVYDPITEWEFGYGAQVRGELWRHLALAVVASRSSFALDTVHRRGDDVVYSRDWFHSWQLQLTIFWLTTLG